MKYNNIQNVKFYILFNKFMFIKFRYLNENSIRIFYLIVPQPKYVILTNIHFSLI